MTNWRYSLGTATVVSGCYGGELEVTWLRECWKKSFDDLVCYDLIGTKEQIRWKRLDCSLSQALQGMIKPSGESLLEDVALKARAFSQRNQILCGQQIIWMIID